MWIVGCFSFILPALQQEVAETESKEELALHLPPCNADADSPENVYLFDDRILLRIIILD